MKAIHASYETVDTLDFPEAITFRILLSGSILEDLMQYSKISSNLELGRADTCIKARTRRSCLRKVYSTWRLMASHITWRQETWGLCLGGRFTHSEMWGRPWGAYAM